jgi:FkbM family methyltransferase
MRDILRKVFLEFNIPITTNLKNDILLKKIIRRVLNRNDNTVDIGCHKGEILELFLRYAPDGKHYAIEPIPYFYERLKQKFSSVKIFQNALSDETGKQTFYWIKNNPAYSGLNKRKFSEKEIQPIEVEVKRLDELIPENVKIKFIKIDVEGAELKVLRGSERIIEQNKPIIAFEFGKGGSDYYNTTADDMYDFFAERNYDLYDFESFLNKANPYTKSTFQKAYIDNIVYNFLAISKQ